MSVTPSPSDAFLAACRGEEVSHTPVWFMRQAGRSLPEYRALRGSGNILSAIRDADLAAEITLQPVRRYGVDAAVLFSDIMAPLDAIGFGVSIHEGVGPVTEAPFRCEEDLDRLGPFIPADQAPWIGQTVRNVVSALDVPLIGFAGGPFTLASYLIEGAPSRDHVKAKRLMFSEPVLWHRLLDALADLSVAFIREQVSAGASAIQVFDSWAGALAPVDYRRYVLPAASKIFDAIRGLGVPGIHFGVSTGELLGPMTETGADVIGVDWRVPLGAAARRAPSAKALQGNLDPSVCLAPWPVVAEAVRSILAERPAGLGHIFNLGHGVLPATDPEVLRRVVELVHLETAAR